MNLETKFLEDLKESKTEGTALNYVSQVRQVIKEEETTFDDLMKNIGTVVTMYSKEKEGKISHNSRRNALIAYEDFKENRVDEDKSGMGLKAKLIKFEESNYKIEHDGN